MLASCAGDEVAQQPPVDGLTRLWSDGSVPPADSPLSTVLHENGADLLQRGSLFDDGIGDRARADLAHLHSERNLALQSGALFARAFPVKAGEEFEVRLRRLPGEGSATVRVLAFRGSLPDAKLSRNLRAMLRSLDEVLVERNWDAKTTRLTDVFAVGSRTSSFVVTVRANDARVVLEEMEILERLASEVQPHSVGGEQRSAVPLPFGDQWTFELPPTNADTRLQLAAALPDFAQRSGQLALHCSSADGAWREQLELPATSPAHHWVDLSYALPEGSESGGKLQLEAVGSGEGAILIAEPILVPAVQVAAEEPPNVILISIDTLRADRLGCYGYERPTSPHLDELAAGGVRFARAYSSSNYTLPGHASMLTGQDAWVLGIGGLRASGALPPVPTLAEILAEHGWLCAAFTGGGFVDPQFGFGRGFDRYSVLDPLLTAENPRHHRTPWADRPEWNVAARENSGWSTVERWLRDHAERRFLLFLHTYHVHDYFPTKDAEARFAPGAAQSCVRPMEREERARLRDQGPDSAEMRALRQLYDATVFDADSMIGQLLAVLDECSLTERTVIIVTSDHGEAFLEHGDLFHASGLHEEVLRVPLIVAGPGVRARVDEKPIGLTDLLPTLLDLLQIPAPWEGNRPTRKLAGSLDPIPSPVQAHDFRADGVHHAWIEGPHKWMESRHGPRLFDLVRDPSETVDLLEQDPRRAEEWQARLDAWLDARDHIRDSFRAAAAAPVHANLQRALEELGYDVGEDSESSER